MNRFAKYSIILIVLGICARYAIRDENFSAGFKNLTQTKTSAELKSDQEKIIISDEFVNYQISKNHNEKKLSGDIQDIIKRGELVVCSVKNEVSKLFRSQTKDGKYHGKDIEFAKKMAKSLGVKLRIKMFYNPYNAVIEAIYNGEGDVAISHLSYTPERSKKVLFSNNYVISKKMLLLNRSNLQKFDNVPVIDILNNKETSIGIEAGSSYEDFVRNIFPKAKIVAVRDFENSVIEKIASGEITAAFYDDIVCKTLLKSKKHLLIKVFPVVLKDEIDDLSIAVDIKNPGLLNWINKFIDAEAKPEDADKLIEKYDGE